MNIAMLTGFLGAEPELKTLESGTAVCTMNLATNQRWTNSDGKKMERTDWHRLVVYGAQAETCAKYLKTGSHVAVRGEIRCNTWKDKEDKTQRSVEILAKNVEFLDRNPDSESVSDKSSDEKEWLF